MTNARSPSTVTAIRPRWVLGLTTAPQATAHTDPAGVLVAA
ncbi:hypothetical protein [Nonomuraea sp. NPDC049784]